MSVFTVLSVMFWLFVVGISLIFGDFINSNYDMIRVSLFVILIVVHLVTIVLSWTELKYVGVGKKILMCVIFTMCAFLHALFIDRALASLNNVIITFGIVDFIAEVIAVVILGTVMVYLYVYSCIKWFEGVDGEEWKGYVLSILCMLGMVIMLNFFFI